MEQIQKSIVDGNISEWVSLYADDLYRWALHKTSDKETAEDIVQETFLAAFKSIDKFKGKSQPKTWLFSIMKNKIMDYHRKKYRETTINQSKLSNGSDGADILENFFDQNGTWKPENNPANWHDMEDHLLDDDDFNEVLGNCMKKLPSNWFSAMSMKYLEEKEGKIICQELGITPSNFWQILHRAKVQLKACLEMNWFNS